MQKAICILFFFLVSFQTLLAADVTVTATAAVNGGANGELFIHVDNSVTEFPLNLTVTYPNGFVQTVVLNNYTYLITGLSAGIYTIQVTNASACLLTLDIEIPNCKLLSGTSSYLCSVIATVCCKELFLTGGEGGFDSNTALNSMTFNAYSSLSTEQFNTIATTVHQTALGIASDVINNGITPYDIIEQNELATNAPLVMKFSESGSLIWVWHDYSKNSVSDYRDAEYSLMSKVPSQDGVRVFPNPASQGNLNCGIDVPKEGMIRIELVTVFGQKLIGQSQYVSNIGNTTFKIKETENIPAGIYFLKITNTDNVEKIERVIFSN